MRREAESPKILVSGNWLFQSSVSWCWPKGTWALGTRLPKSGEKPYLEVLYRFGLWRDFLNGNIPATISAFRLIKNMSINPRSVEFHQCHAKPHSICFVFFITLSKITKEIFAKICWQLKTPTWKVHALHYANELLVRVRLSFQNLLQNRSTYRNNTKTMFGKRVMTRTRCGQEYRPGWTIIRFLRFYVFTTTSTSKKMFSFRVRAEKGIARHIDASNVVVSSNFWLVRSEHAHASYPGLFFRPPGSAPIWGGKKGEFRDWTMNVNTDENSRAMSALTFLLWKLNTLQ